MSRNLDIINFMNFGKSSLPGILRSVLRCSCEDSAIKRCDGIFKSKGFNDSVVYYLQNF